MASSTGERRFATLIERSETEGGIEAEGARRVFVGGQGRICADLDVEVAAEGVETKAGRCALRGLGVTLLQGFLSARPASVAVPAEELRRISAG